jgi:hypothetical protein
VDISAICSTQPLPDPAVAIEPNGVFFDLMAEITAENANESSAEVTGPAAWTLLNADSLQALSIDGDEAQNTSPDEKENDGGFITAAVPAAGEPPPVLPLALNLAMKFDVRRVTAVSGEYQNDSDSKGGPRRTGLEGQPILKEPAAVTRGSGAPRGELAFAARIAGQDNALPDALVTQPQVQTPIRHPQAGTHDTQAGDRLTHGIEGADDSGAVSAQDPETAAHEPRVHQWHDTLPAVNPSRTEGAQQPIKAHAVHTAPPVADLEQPAEPVREVSLAIDGADGRVRLRMETHAGELRAWVTGNNAETVDRIRAELPELSRSLKDSGFKSDLWTPHSIKQVDAATELHAGSEHGQRHFGADDQRHHDGSRRRRPQPDWFEQMEES